MTDRFEDFENDLLDSGVKREDWYGLYRTKWKDDIIKISYGHPAKFARGLIAKIYAHFFKNGWLKEGDTVIDPFGGIALGALDIMLKGGNWVGIEIEPRFNSYANGAECDGQISSVTEEGRTFTGWYIIAPFINGDEEGENTFGFVCADGVIYYNEQGDPPNLDGFDTEEEAQTFLAGLRTDEASDFPLEDVRIESCRFTHKKVRIIPALCGERKAHDPHHMEGNFEMWDRKYAGRMPKWGHGILLQGDSRNLVNVLRDNADKISWLGLADGCASSPPFISQTGGTNPMASGTLADEGLLRRHAAGNLSAHGYGEGEENLGNMKGEDFDASLSSPPFTQDHRRQDSLRENWENKGGRGFLDAQGFAQEDGNLARSQDGDFDAAVSSPAYGDIAQSGGTEGLKAHGTGLTGGERSFTEYGEQEGNLGRMEVDGFDGSLSSPPFIGSLPNGDTSSSLKERYPEIQTGGDWGQEYGNEENNLGNLPDENFDAAVASPPHNDTPVPTYMPNPGGGIAGRNSADIEAEEWRASKGYGNMPQQIGEKMDAGLSSPPYAETRIDGRGDEGSSNIRNEDGSYLRGAEGWEERKAMGERYGETDGQLGAMESDLSKFDSSLSSPPFEDVTSDRPSESIVASGLKMGQSSMGDGYGSTEGNIGSQSGDDFWMASRRILENLHTVLKAGGYAAFVVKRYVKGGKLEPFPAKWAMLAQAVGFEIVEWNRAWVIEEKGSQWDIFGNLNTKIVQRKSFFRMLAEKKGSPPIDFEEVIIVRKASKQVSK